MLVRLSLENVLIDGSVLATSCGGAIDRQQLMPRIHCASEVNSKRQHQQTGAERKSASSSSATANMSIRSGTFLEMPFWKVEITYKWMCIGRSICYVKILPLSRQCRCQMAREVGLHCQLPRTIAAHTADRTVSLWWTYLWIFVQKNNKDSFRAHVPLHLLQATPGGTVFAAV